MTYSGLLTKQEGQFERIHEVNRYPQRPGIGSVTTCVRQRGLSLIELMVAIAIGSFVVLVVSSLFANISKGFRTLDDSGRAGENGNFALKTLTEDIRMAGFIGYAADTARVPELSRTNLVSSTTSANCGSADFPFQFLDANNRLNYLQFIPNLTDSNPLTCIPSGAFLENSPAIVIRRASGVSQRDANNDGNLANDFTSSDNQLYVQTSPKGSILFMGKDYQNQVKAAGRHRVVSFRDTSNVVSQRDATAFQYITHVYYLRPCSQPTGSGGLCTSGDDNGTPVPTLVRRQLAATDPATFIEVAIAEGVERIGVQFGVDRNGDGVPELYENANATNAAEAITARLSLLIRPRALQTGYDDRGFSYDLGSFTYQCAAADCAPFRRFVLTDTVQLKNYGLRR